MGDWSHEPSASITWMLQSAEINDSALAEALVTEFYTGVIAFAQTLSGNSHLATSAGQAAIIQAVTRRYRFWGETSLQAWLYRLVYLHLRKNGIQDRQSPSQQAQTARKRVPGKFGAIPSDHPGLILNDPLPFLLYYGHGLTEAEIAYILGRELAHLLSNLNQDRMLIFTATHPSFQPHEFHSRFIEASSLAQMGLLDNHIQGELEQHLAGCPLCQAYLSQLPKLEVTWKEELKPASLRTAQVRVACRHILAILSKKAKDPKQLLPYKEFSLVITLVLLLVLFGRTQGIFEASDPHSQNTALPASTSNPTRTPQPTPTPAPLPFELIGYEGDEFFFFDTWTVDGDTWRTIAEKASLREDLVRYLNPTLPEQLARSTRIKLAGLKSSPLFQTTHTSQLSPAPIPLGSSSSTDEILQRAINSTQYWDTLFVDQVFIDYGPPGYSGPALHTSRTQTFASLPYHWISIQAEPDRLTNVVTYVAGDWIFRRPPRSGRLSAVWIPVGSDKSSLPLTDPDLPQAGHFINAGEDLIATRPAVILDWFNEAGWRQQRLWFDALTGTLLKHELYSSPPDEIILQSFMVIEIFYDLPLPDDYFFPPSSSYLQFINRRVIDELQLVSERLGISPQGSVPVTNLVPPLGFDPSQYPFLLKFPFLSNVDEGSVRSQSDAGLQ